MEATGSLQELYPHVLEATGSPGRVHGGTNPRTPVAALRPHVRLCWERGRYPGEATWKATGSSAETTGTCRIAFPSWRKLAKEELEETLLSRHLTGRGQADRGATHPHESQWRKSHFWTQVQPIKEPVSAPVRSHPETEIRFWKKHISGPFFQQARDHFFRRARCYFFHRPWTTFPSAPVLFLDQGVGTFWTKGSALFGPRGRQFFSKKLRPVPASEMSTISATRASAERRHSSQFCIRILIKGQYS
jgi:hypothetical protein